MQRVIFGFPLEEICFLFIVGCIIGFFVESFFCLVCTGRIESKKGMVYGPFNQVYGIGGVVLMLLLSPLKHKRNGLVFLAAGLVGGLFEAVCSYFQEKMFQTVSWQYSDQPCALFGGRTGLKYMVYWGVLGTIYLRVLHPIIFGLYSHIPIEIRTVLIGSIMVFLAYNLFLSALAVGRWQARQDGIEASDRLSALLDKRFPDARMKQIYPNMMRVSRKRDSAGEPVLP